MKALGAHYGVTRAGYYAWRRREKSHHAQADERLLVRIQAIFAASDGTYGSPRIHAALLKAGSNMGRKRVARLMRETGLKARVARIYRRMPGTRTFFTAIPNRVLNLKDHDIRSDLGRRRDVSQQCRSVALPGGGHGSPLAPRA